jgi:hypothetical protein
MTEAALGGILLLHGRFGDQVGGEYENFRMLDCKE